MKSRQGAEDETIIEVGENRLQEDKLAKVEKE
jgi:hypothetical protein